MKPILGTFFCLMLVSTGCTNSKISKINGDSYSYSMSAIIAHELEKYEFENLGKDVKQKSITYHYKRITSYEELTLLIETLQKDDLLWETGAFDDEKKLAYWDTNYFEENALIVTILQAPTISYYYECESVTIEDETVLLTLNVSNSSIGDMKQFDLFIIETKRFPNEFPIKMLLVEEQS